METQRKNVETSAKQNEKTILDLQFQCMRRESLEQVSNPKAKRPKNESYLAKTHKAEKQSPQTKCIWPCKLIRTK